MLGYIAAIVLAQDSGAKVVSYRNRAWMFETLEDFYNAIAGYTSALAFHSQELFRCGAVLRHIKRLGWVPQL